MNKKHPNPPLVVRAWWTNMTEMDEVTDYRRMDHDLAMEEIKHLVDRVSNGDISLVSNTGYPRRFDLNQLLEGCNNS